MWQKKYCLCLSKVTLLPFKYVTGKPRVSQFCLQEKWVILMEGLPCLLPTLPGGEWEGTHKFQIDDFATQGLKNWPYLGVRQKKIDTLHVHYVFWAQTRKKTPYSGEKKVRNRNQIARQKLSLNPFHYTSKLFNSGVAGECSALEISWYNLGTLSKDHTENTMPTSVKMIPFCKDPYSKKYSLYLSGNVQNNWLGTLFLHLQLEPRPPF